MAETFILNAEERKTTGKEYAAQLRAEGKLPAVVYGPDLKDNLYVALNYRDFDKIFETCGRHHIIEVTMGSKKVKTVIKDYKIHPISRLFLHADFYAVSPDKEFETEVPINYVGTPVGVKEGGTKFTFLRKLKIRTKPGSLPDKINVDVSQLKIKQYMIVRDVKVTGDYKIMTHEGNVLVEIK